MKVCVLGLWHLGSVTAACMASLGHRIVALDLDAQRVADLRAGGLPVVEPHLEELQSQGRASGGLRFDSSPHDATAGARVLWVTCDTPLGDDGQPQPQIVRDQLERVLPCLDSGTLVLVSAQLPVGSTRSLAQHAAGVRGSQDLRWAYMPENLRLGSAVNDFLRPDRLVVGATTDCDRSLLQELLGPIGAPIEWMSLESAEMTKHALNAFLALSVAFANEVASVCEVVDADAKQVERGLKTDRRIGEGAYLAPGAAFSGGTLARDVSFLDGIARAHRLHTPLLSAVLPSNAAHRLWARRTLRGLFADLSRTTIALWGLTYKAGTDTLRGSAAVELCDWILRQGATLRVHDPAVTALPSHWDNRVERSDSPIAAVRGADALIISFGWPTYSEVSARQLVDATTSLVVLDPNRSRPDLAAADVRLRYFAVGLAGKTVQL